MAGAVPLFSGLYNQIAPWSFANHRPVEAFLGARENADDAVSID
jgi:hypothetical protein